VEYEFDRQHGTPLYVTRSSAGETTGVVEVMEVDYEPEIEPSVFGFLKRDGHTTPARAQRMRPRPVVPHPDSRPPRAPRPALSTLGTVWLTGLSGAGKTTIAEATERLLRQLGLPCCVLDGDQLRQGLSNDLGLSREDRREQARRAAYIAVMLADAGVMPIVALVSPYTEDRQRAREIHRAAGISFVEVWVDTPVEVCAARDRKGLYAIAALDGPRLGENDKPADGSGLTGITAPYEAPSNPELRVSGHDQEPRAAAETIVARVFSTPPRSRVMVVSDFGAAD
jgi:adenylyl-sulfate kinase